MHRYGDRIKEAGSASGTGSYTLTGAVAGYRSFDTIGDGAQCYYCAEAGAVFEVGEGYYNATTRSLSRVRILSSSNGGAPIAWGNNALAIMVVAPSEAIERAANTGISVYTAGTLQVMYGTSRWYAPTQCHFSWWEAWVGEAPSTDIQFTIYKNSSELVVSGTITGGAHLMERAPCAIDMVQGDYLTLGISQIGSPQAGGDLTVRLLP